MDIADGAEIDKRWLIDDFVFSQPTIEAYRTQALQEARIQFKKAIVAQPGQVQQALSGAPPGVADTFGAMGLLPGRPAAPPAAPIGGPPVPPEATLQSALQTGQVQRRIQNVRVPQ